MQLTAKNVEETFVKCLFDEGDQTSNAFTLNNNFFNPFQHNKMKFFTIAIIATLAISCTKNITTGTTADKLPEQLAQPCKCPDTLITPQGNRLIICKDTLVPQKIADLKR